MARSSLGEGGKSSTPNQLIAIVDLIAAMAHDDAYSLQGFP